MSNAIYNIKTFVKWDTNGNYLTTIDDLLSEFTVNLIVWDNTGPITSSTIVKEKLRRVDPINIRLWATCSLTDTYLIEIVIGFTFPLDTYRKYSEIPLSFWDAERSALLSQLGTWTYTVVDGYVE